MILYSILVVLILTLTGLAALHRAHKAAIDGYEDEYGFHPGAAPVSFGKAEIHEMHTTTSRAA